MKVVNSSWVDDRVVTHHIDIPIGKPYDDEQVRTEVMRLHGLDYFGTIDDHEIIRMLGPDKILPVAEMPGELMATEVGHPGQQVRYRPTDRLLAFLQEL